MKKVKQLTAMATTLLMFVACQKESREVPMTGEIATSRRPDLNNVAGHVYTLSNQTGGNEVLDYTRSANGMLAWSASYSTGGTGTGGGLGNQGALVLTDHGSCLLAINPGSNTIASLKIHGEGLSLVSTVSSGGIMPVSIAQHDNLVYVLNAGGDGNISGFNMDADGNLSPIGGSTKPLSSSMSGPAQVSFVQDGKVLAITEKATNRIVTYTVDSWGIPGSMKYLSSANATPFGFAAGHNNMIYVTEAAGGSPAASTVSAYHISENGDISLVTGPVSAGQTAACWAVATNNGKYVYATNTGDNNVSSFTTDASGNLEVLAASAGSTEGGPIDAALSTNSKFLYALNAVGHSISVFAVGNDGELDGLQTITGIPAGATGLISK